MTYKELSANCGVKIESIRRRARREGFTERIKADETANQTVVNWYADKLSAAPPDRPARPARRDPGPKPSPNRTKHPDPPGRTKADVRTDVGANTANPDKVSAVFGSRIALLSAAFVLVGLGGFAFSNVASTVLGRHDYSTLVFFGFAGAVVHYAGLMNAYRQSLKATKWNNPAEPWIWGFAIFEGLLHGCNFGAFGEYNTSVSVAIMSIALPLATAAVAIVMLNGKE